jgi:hypothetical protein
LRAIKTVHTLIWAFFVGCILAIPIEALRGEFVGVLILVTLVLSEVLIVMLNSRRCPLTAVAARYTSDRRDNFDIYLPEWLARHNQVIFGLLFLADLIFSGVLWLNSSA